MRALHRKEAIEYADQLREMVNERTEPYPMNTTERNNLLRYIALVFSERRRAADACEIMAMLCKQSPKVAALHREYAFALANDSRFDKAESALKRAIELQADNVNSHAQLGHVYCRTGRAEAGCNSYSRAATLDPGKAKYLQRLLFWSNYSERSTPRSNYQLAKLWAERAFPNTQANAKAFKIGSPDRILKIGFVSSDFCKHSNQFFILPLLNSLDRREFHVTAYSDTKKLDRVSKSIRAICDDWRSSSAMNDAQLTEQITADQIDILVDLNGHTRGNRLGVFASQAAPIQLSWLGYPSTTGIKSIAYRISDRIADPMGLSEQFYSETLLRLPNGFLCYQPPATAPDIKMERGDQPIRFGSFNNLAKVSNITLDCWAAALLAVPNSTLTIKHQSLRSKKASSYFLRQFNRRGISKSRIKLRSSKTKIEQHMSLYNEIDIALDTSPFNGLTSTLEALWMGVPIISLVGQTYASRTTASILHRLELDKLGTKTIFEFAERARELSESPETLADYRSNLRKRMTDSPLMDNRQFAREFSTALKEQWRKWCHEHSLTEGLVQSVLNPTMEVER